VTVLLDANVLIALVVASAATLTVPAAVRRMIDFGFGGSDASARAAARADGGGSAAASSAAR
jgi:hypothetical protein